MDPSIVADLPEETRNAIEAFFASYAAGLMKAQQEDRAASREEEERRNRDEEQAQENEPRSSTVQSPEQFPQDYVRARQQGWAAAPHPDRSGPSVFGRTDIGLGYWTANERRDVEDGELMWMEEGRRVEGQELVSVEQESSLPPLWTEKPGWWLDRVPSETPTPMSPLKRVNMELGMVENTEKVVMKESEDTGHEEDRVPGLGLAVRHKHQQKQESPLATWPDEEKEQEELAETLVQQQQPISQSPPLSPPLPPPPPTPDESVWMIRRRKRRTKGVGRARRVTGGVVAQHRRSRSSRQRIARRREK